MTPATYLTCIAIRPADRGSSVYLLFERLRRGRRARRGTMADELASAVRTGDWPTAYAIGEHLSLDVACRPI